VKRREVIALLGGAVAWPSVGRTQQPGKLATIGFLGIDPVLFAPLVPAFTQRLRELGWTEGQNVTIDYRWSEGRPERAAEIASEFVHLKVDVILTSGTAAAIVKRTTTDIPIVFAAANDPIGGGLVSNLARPGGNVTGLSNEATDLASKRLQFLYEVTGGSLRRLAILVNVGFSQTALELSEAQAAARTLDLDVTLLEIRRPEDIAPAFGALRVPADALYVVGDAVLNANSARIVALALGARLPTIFNNRSFVQPGGLMSYGPNIADQYRRAADLVDKILRGTKPGDIPVEQPTKFELVINLKTAKSLGLKVPQTLLATADEVIE
jgi:putative tryptophan/tyrosine transport system substrate-binding protein